MKNLLANGLREDQVLVLVRALKKDETQLKKLSDPSPREKLLIKIVGQNLERIIDGYFGQCEYCEADIGFHRLLVCKWTTHCSSCAADRLEKEQEASDAKKAEREEKRALQNHLDETSEQLKMLGQIDIRLKAMERRIELAFGFVVFHFIAFFLSLLHK